MGKPLRRKTFSVFGGDPDSQSVAENGGPDGIIVMLLLTSLGFFAGAVALWGWTPRSSSPALCIFGGIFLTALGLGSGWLARRAYAEVYGPKFQADAVVACLICGFGGLALAVLSHGGIGSVMATPYVLLALLGAVLAVLLTGAGIAGIACLRPRRRYEGARVHRRYAVDGDGNERDNQVDPEAFGMKAWVEFRTPRGLDCVRVTGAQYAQLSLDTCCEVILRGNRIVELKLRRRVV